MQSFRNRFMQYGEVFSFAIEFLYWGFFYRLCIETPRMGSRFLHTWDEDLLELAKQREWWAFRSSTSQLIFAEVEIPVIVVFTKYDLLVLEHYHACSHISSPSNRKVEAKERAKLAFSEFTKELKVPFTPVSTRYEYGQWTKSVNSLFSFK